mgnify:CR=1 FL=1
MEYVALFFLTVLGMEAVAWLMHRYLMHGPLWVLHKSHHRRREGRFELNDAFGLFFAIPSMILIWYGVRGHPALLALGLGMTAYGALYFFFHDMLVHRRVKLPFVPKRGYLHRVVRAHLLHHRTTTKHGAVSFGFLFAENPDKLLATLKARAGSDGLPPPGEDASHDEAGDPGAHEKRHRQHQTP